MQQILAKVAHNERIESELLLVSHHFAEELESTIKTNFNSEVDTQLKELVAEFADVTQKP